MKVLQILNIFFIISFLGFFAKAQDNPLFTHGCLSKSDCVQEAIINGADVEAKTESGQTPLLIAIDMGNTHVVRVLLDNGATPPESGARAYLNMMRLLNDN